MWDEKAQMFDADREKWDSFAKDSYEKIQAAKARAESTDELTQELKDSQKRAADFRKLAADSRAEALDCRAEAARPRKVRSPSYMLSPFSLSLL